MPNNFAYLALLSWPLVVIYFLNRFKVGNGTLLSLLGAYMFLPASFSVDLPGFPDLDKFSITTLTILIFIIFRGNTLGIRSLDKRFKILLILFIISPFLTAVTNQEYYLHLPGLSLYDGLSSSVIRFLEFVPFLIGFAYFREEKDHINLFKYFAIAAIIYALFALYEIRMSPQLHSTLYGYFPHSWRQQYRSGGFRAVVFMGHGLLVAFFLAVGLASLAAMKKAKVKVIQQIDTRVLLVFLLLTLVLMKSVAAFVFGLFMFLMITFFSTRLIHLATLTIALLFLTYPITSAMKVFPHDAVSNIAGMIDLDRQQSLVFRFDNEEILLDHANHKPLFGWGGWGRNRVFDPETGEDISITDGKWILTLGSRGWVGFLAEFLFFVIPIWLAYKLKSQREISERERNLLAAHALIVAIILLDQMPNASMNALYWLVVGALLGRVYAINKQLKESKTYRKPSNDTAYKQTV